MYASIQAIFNLMEILYIFIFLLYFLTILLYQNKKTSNFTIDSKF